MCDFRRWIPCVLPAGLLPACAHAPTYLRTYGDVGDREATLGWILLIISLAVIGLIAVLVLAGIARGRLGNRREAERQGNSPDALRRTGGGLSWIIIGGIVGPALVLIVLFVYSTTVLTAVTAPVPSTTDAFTVRVIGHRWWWEVQYTGGAPSDNVTTANEIHLPVGTRVRVELETADVIHSFWVPQLAGKTDLIPGQRNAMWLQADTAGTYWGQCAEYCGLQHAKMSLRVRAESPADFSRWLSGEREPAAPVTSDDPDAAAGQAVFTRSACALCHTIRGTGAGGRLGPDLTHLASRSTIAAGILPNTPGNLAGWIGNPQAIKPGNDMPMVALQPAELHALVRYLESLH